MMKHNYTFRYLLFLAICCNLLCGCFDEISFDGSEEQLDNLAIQGKLIKGTPSIVSVSITKVSPFTGFEVPQPVEAARVVLLDEEQNEVELHSPEPGLFQLEIFDGQNGLEIREGKAYRINVITEAGIVYESALEPLLPVPTPSSIDIEPIIREEINESGNILENTYLQFFINTPLTTSSGGPKSYLKWELKGVYRFIETTPAAIPPPSPKICYFTEGLNLDKVKVFSGPASSQNNLTGQFLVEIEPGFHFARGYYLTVYQQSLSEKAFEYWSQVSQIVERTGSVFEPAPGKVKGNILNTSQPEEEVFGYFYVSMQDTFRIKVHPEVAGYPRAFCPPSDDGSDIPDVCFNCLLWPSSTLEKPDYWVD